MAKRHVIDFDLLHRSDNSIAQGYLTNSKNPDCFIKGITPTHVSRGVGAYLYDTRGKRFIDFICGLGTNLFGYANYTINEVVRNEIERGVTYSLGSLREVEAAERFQSVFPFAERVKFLKTGSEACTAAVRMARNYTGRKHVLSMGYHGWHDEFTSLTPPACGIVDHAFIHKIDNIDDLIGRVNPMVAAVILEPVELDNSTEHVKKLNMLRDRCTKHGAVLIFDEVITGFRYKGLSVSNYFNIRPDTICCGKALGNGFPLSVVAGKKDILGSSEYFVSSTHAGENLSLTAMIKVIDLLTKDTNYSIDRLWSAGEDFVNQFNTLWPEKIIIKGYPTRGRFVGDNQVIWKFWQECIYAGILFGPSFFINFCHIEILDNVMHDIKDIIGKIKSTGDFKLDGRAPRPPFSNKFRGDK
jgi:glutamate-1-semialdehyde aminotransferase